MEKPGMDRAPSSMNLGDTSIRLEVSHKGLPTRF